MKRRSAPCAVAATQRGFVMLVAVVLIVVAALILSAMVFMSATGTDSSDNNLQSGQALFEAESGLDYGQRQLAQDVDWYRDTSDPAITTAGSCPPDTITQNLGPGTFTVCTNKPATMLRRNLSSSANYLCVYTVDRFPASGALQIDDDISNGAEFVTYTGTTSSLAACGNLPAFTGVARGQTFNGVGALANNHYRDDHVYPLTTLIQAGGLPNSCTTPTSFQIADNLKFLSAGTISLDDGTNYELILYTGSTRSGGVMTLTGVQRCQPGTTTLPGAGWPVNFPVTPITAQPSNPVQFETEISSVGSVGSAVRMERKTVQR